MPRSRDLVSNATSLDALVNMKAMLNEFGAAG